MTRLAPFIKEMPLLRRSSSSASTSHHTNPVACCLKPTWSLRRQVLFSFGITGVVTTALVVGMACICAIRAGHLVQTEARNFMRQEVIDSISNSSRYAAETFGQELDHLRGTVSLMVEIVRDRISNYPLEGWEDDGRVPFVTVDNGRRLYPLRNPLLPRDWNVTINVNGSNHREHLQELFELLNKQHDPDNTHQHETEFVPKLSTVSAAYSFQGNCDPRATSENDPTYYEGCTDEHNNATSGGIQPTSTSAGLEQKAADIGALLKPIWESRADLLQVTVHFVNEGAGSLVHFPSFVHSNRRKAYRSQGCDWLHTHANPYTGRPFLTQEQTQRNCRPNGTWVDARDFNPLEQAWCRDQALHPNETRFFGPIIDGFFTPGGLDVIEVEEGHEVFFWVMRVGRAIFDRYTGEFIGCVAIGVLLNRWTELIMETLAVQNHSRALLVRETDGIVVAGGSWELYDSRELKLASETEVVESKSFYGELMEELEIAKLRQESKEKAKDRQKQANPSQKRKPPAHKAKSAATAIAECSSGRVLSAAALPGSPFVYVQAVGPEVFDVIDDVKRSIDQDIIYSTVLALLIGGVGMVILMIIVYTMSMVLTRPLSWIQGVAYNIVNHTTANLERKSLKSKTDFEQDSSELEDVEQSLSRESIFGNPNDSTVRCSPDTEITELVEEFQHMIRGFSGAGKSSTVAKSTAHEIRNTLTWQSDFQHLYKKARGGAEVYHSAIQGFDMEKTTIIEEDNIDQSADVQKDHTNSDKGGVGAFAVQVADIMVKEKVLSPKSEKEAGTSECLFRSTRRQHGDSPELSVSMTTGKEANVKPDFIRALSATTGTTSTMMTQSPNEGWKNEGRNLNPPRFAKKDHQDVEGSSFIPFQSPLFRWILVLIVIPMIVTNIVILAAVSIRITAVLPQWLNHVETASFIIQLDDVSVASKFASIYAEAVMATPVRDLFVFNRVAGWLFTGAIERNTEALVEMGSGSEECKAYAEDCPWYDDPFKNAPCDCSWEVSHKPTKDNRCFRIEDDTRHMQRLFFGGQQHDADPVTGARNSTSYPFVDASAEDTSWWYDQTSVPGAYKKENASGYETTYDRLSVFSALSVMIFPLYNYRLALESPQDHAFLGTFFGFESDGMLAGWAGCTYPSPNLPHFKSKHSNRAFKINRTLCPRGKYGYDARCRDWYDTGKTMALNSDNVTSMYIAPPYEFVSLGLTASSVTQGVTDPDTGEHIGQSVVDFQQFEMVNFGLLKRDDGFHFVISPSGDDRTGDTVVPPDRILMKDFDTAMIGDLILPYDDKNSSNRRQFDEVVSLMKQGNACLKNFTRLTKSAVNDGDDLVVRYHNETIWLAYDPIHVRALDAVQIDDYSKGVNVSNPLVYSLGVGRTLKSLEKPFMDFKEDASEKLQRNVNVYIGMTILISLLATIATCLISVAVTRPMITLLTVVQNINKGKIDDDIPPLYGGSREVNQVYTSFAKLYKIVRVSNSAFYMRNLRWACHFVRDALKLFTKIDDRKAVAIASSNLGSTLLAINSGRPRASHCSCSMVDSVCCVKEAFLHFETAIRSGSEDFENAPTMDKKVEFAEQLSDRHFNRGLYFLLSQEDPCAEENYFELGIQDLMKAQALDLDVQEYWIENGMLMQKASVLFERLLRRLYGLCALLERDVPQNIWDPKAVAYDCHRVLSAVWDDPSDPLFDEFTPIGRLQQLEGALIHLQLQRDQVSDAARIAMRMLVEDEYMNEAAFQYAAEAMLKYMTVDSPSEMAWPVLSKALVERDIQNMIKSSRSVSVQTKKCIFYCMEISDTCHMKNPQLRHELLSLYDSHCGKDDWFGLVASNANNPLAGDNNLIQLRVESKQQKQGEQRSGIESAIDALSTSEGSVFDPMSSSASGMSTSSSLEMRLKARFAKSCKTLSAALERVVESDVSAIYDSYILYVTDGPKRSWDWKVLSSLKSRIEEVNAKRRGDIHLIILDLEDQPEMTKKGEERDGLSATCTNLCRVSKGSSYINASLSTIENDFDDIRACLTVGNKSRDRKSVV